MHMSQMATGGTAPQSARNDAYFLHSLGTRAGRAETLNKLPFSDEQSRFVWVACLYSRVSRAWASRKTASRD